VAAGASHVDPRHGRRLEPARTHADVGGCLPASEHSWRERSARHRLRPLLGGLRETRLVLVDDGEGDAGDRETTEAAVEEATQERSLGGGETNGTTVHLRPPDVGKRGIGPALPSACQASAMPRFQATVGAPSGRNVVLPPAPNATFDRSVNECPPKR